MVFATALRCVPYVRPDHWAGAKMAEDLPGWSRAFICNALWAPVWESAPAWLGSAYEQPEQAV